MFSKAKNPTALEAAIDKALAKLDEKAVGTAEYDAIVDEIVKLHAMKVNEKPDRVSLDTWAKIAANLVGIMLIIRHEHVNVISSKAMDMVTKLR